MENKIIAVDFDGTLCENKWPEIGEANKEMITYLKGRQSNGDKLILWTCRVDDILKNAVDWSAEQGLIFDAVNENLPEIVASFGTDTRKIFANEYIDDRNAWYPDKNSRLIEKANELVLCDCKAQRRVSQSVYLIEEMAELIKEITKSERFKGDIGHIQEEIADVLCTILTYSVSTGICFEDINNIMIQKFDRGIERLKHGEQ